ncbi:MAG: ATP synthase F1 subunit delta [Candidatus Aminicenantes bacterium]|nr:MAG: ATP synthase F1 subunit delta [Candidatus Aminicenantes bacterium]
MRNLLLVKRYSEGLVKALESRQEFSRVYQELQTFQKILQNYPQLDRLLVTPILSPNKRREIARSLFQLWPEISDKTKRFLLLLIENGRVDILPEILAYLPDIWNEEKGIVTFDVYSVIDLTSEEKKKLQEKLARLEGAPVDVRFHLDPGLIGGISVRKGNIIYDLSLQGCLERLKESLIKG